MIGLRRLRHAPMPVRRTDEGAVAVEFAFVMPLLMLFVFGIVEFGFALTQQASLAHGAREAARLGVVNIVTSPTCADVIAEARRSAQTVGMGESDVAVTVVQAGRSVCSVGAGSATPASGVPPCTDAPAADEMLRVTTTFQTSIDIPVVPGSPEVTLSGEGAYRCEYN